MVIEIYTESSAILDQYAQVPMAFESDVILEVSPVEGGLGGLTLTERRLETPFKKDYDAVEGEGPRSWAQHFDLTNWGFLVARKKGALIGGAAVAFNTQGVHMLEGRQDLAVLWDIRVAPEHQGLGIGHRLFKAAEAWAISRQCRTLKIETQNNNVPACSFYRRQGCELGAINRFAYPLFPDESQLLWYKNLFTEPSEP